MGYISSGPCRPFEKSFVSFSQNKAGRGARLMENSLAIWAENIFSRIMKRWLIFFVNARTISERGPHQASPNVTNIPRTLTCMVLFNGAETARSSISSFYIRERMVSGGSCFPIQDFREGQGVCTRNLSTTRLIGSTSKNLVGPSQKLSEMGNKSMVSYYFGLDTLRNAYSQIYSFDQEMTFQLAGEPVRR